MLNQTLYSGRQAVELSDTDRQTAFRPLTSGKMPIPAPVSTIRALCHAHASPHQTQPAIGHAANMHLMATVMHLAKPVEVADNPRRLNALFKNTPELQNGAFPVPSGPGPGLELDLEKLEPRIKPL